MALLDYARVKSVVQRSWPTIEKGKIKAVHRLSNARLLIQLTNQIKFQL